MLAFFRALAPRLALLALLVAIAYPLSLLKGKRMKPRGRPVAIDYLREVKPILTRHCAGCHAGRRVRGGLRIETAALIRAGGDSGPAIVPYDPDASLLIAAVEGRGASMPPTGSPLPREEIDRLRAWVRAGAPAPANEKPPPPVRHWAFQPPIAPPIPLSLHANNAIDAFLALQRDHAGLVASQPADPGLLLRRLYLDLVGVPPTLAEHRAFVNDVAPDAYARVVDRLLADPRHGERWGRHWMDVWRYADPDGRKKFDDLWWSNAHLWRWRDWIINALNTNRGYDQLVQHMLAGDEIDPEDTDTLAATGFLVRNWFKLNRNIWLNNTIEHTSKAFLGLTMGCARCHDHKFDPITQREYYAFRAYFEPHDIREQPIAAAPGRPAGTLARIFDAHPTRATHVFQRGDETRPKTREAMTPGVPRSLGWAPATRTTQGPGSTGRRLALARWITEADNPLTARVAVNQVWLRHFGQALVEPVDNLGQTTPAPRQQPLLDWLATEFIRRGWDLKWLHRQIVLSATYQMRSQPESHTRSNLSCDPDNRLYWRGPRRRMEAETIRDSLLHVSESLDSHMGGPPLALDWDSIPARRTLYYRSSREDKLPFLAAFDPANVQECYRRRESIVPHQALTLSNSPLVWQAAAQLAERLSVEASSPEQFIEEVYITVLGRSPSTEERKACMTFLVRHDSRERARVHLVHALFQHNDFVEIR